MYKKLWVSMLLTVVLAGCGHQSSNKQGDQMDTALPIQDQITNPAPVTTDGSEPAKPNCPTPAEPTQTPPADSTQPAASATTPATDKDAAAAAAKSAADAAAAAAKAAQ